MSFVICKCSQLCTCIKLREVIKIYQAAQKKGKKKNVVSCAGFEFIHPESQ